MSQLPNNNYSRINSHIEGLTYLSINSIKETIISGGNDGLMKCHEIHKLGREEPKILQNQFNEPITGVQFTGFNLLISTDLGEIHQFNNNSLKFEKILYKNNLPIKKLLLSSNKLRVGFIDSEHVIKLILIVNPSDYIELGKGFKLVSFVYHPQGFQIASIDTEGNLIIWELTSTDNGTKAEVYKTIEAATRPGIDLNSGESLGLCYSTDGKYLIVPDIQDSLQIYDINDYSVVHELPSDDYPINHCRFLNEDFFIYSTLEPKLKVVKVENWETVRAVDLHHPIVDLSWNAQTSKLIATDNEGGLISLSSLLNTDSQVALDYNIGSQPFPDSIPPKQSDLEELHDIPEEEDSENDVDDDNHQDDKMDIDEVSTSRHTRLQFSHNKQSIINPNRSQRATFIPGCYESSILNRSSLHYTHNGLITLSYLDDTTYIQVEYLDKGNNRGFTISNEDTQFNMGYIGEYGVLLGKSSPNRKDENAFVYQSTLLHDEDVQFRVKLPKGTQLLGLCLTKLGPLAITNDCRMHWYDRTGRSIRVQQTHHNNFITVCSHPNGRILLLYAHGLRYKFSLITANSNQDIQNTVPLTDLNIPYDDKIVWAGFTDEGIPLIFTAKGSFFVFQYNPINYTGLWYPIIDLNLRDESELYFPIGGTFGQVYCVKIDPKDSWLFRPRIFDLNWSLPQLVNQQDAELKRMEQTLKSTLLIIQLLANNVQNGNADREQEELLADKELERDKLILKLIHKHCQLKDDTRVFELVKILPNERDIANSIRLIQHSGNQKLANQVQNYFNQF